MYNLLYKVEYLSVKQWQLFKLSSEYFNNNYTNGNLLCIFIMPIFV